MRQGQAEQQPWGVACGLACVWAFFCPYIATSSNQSGLASEPLPLPDPPPLQVTFFMRKGADLLSKWVGEAERQLRLLFSEAARCQPAIIFFDEIDGLAPVSR